MRHETQDEGRIDLRQEFRDLMQLRRMVARSRAQDAELRAVTQSSILASIRAMVLADQALERRG